MPIIYAKKKHTHTHRKMTVGKMNIQTERECGIT